MASALSFLKKERSDLTVRRFLEHAEQRFRLSYLLGTLPDAGAEQEREEEEEDETDREEALAGEDRAHLIEKLRAYLDQVQTVAASASKRLEESLGLSLESASQADRDTFEELLEESLRDADDFHELVDDVMVDIESRFAQLTDDELRRGPGDWPELWFHRCPAAVRAGFIRRVNRFCSNQAAQFGTLLTPLVEGIRVRGPFAPIWNGQMRLLAAPNSALRSIVSSGQQSKLVFAFTHFDLVQGPNLPNRTAREQHVLASLDQSIGALGKEISRGVENALRRTASERSFFLSNIQDQIPNLDTHQSVDAAEAAQTGSEPSGA